MGNGAFEICKQSSNPSPSRANRSAAVLSRNVEVCLVPVQPIEKHSGPQDSGALGVEELRAKGPSKSANNLQTLRPAGPIEAQSFCQRMWRCPVLPIEKHSGSQGSGALGVEELWAKGPLKSANNLQSLRPAGPIEAQPFCQSMWRCALSQCCQ